MYIKIKEENWKEKKEKIETEKSFSLSSLSYNPLRFMRSTIKKAK